MVNIKQKGSVGEHIEDLQKFNLTETNIPEEHEIDVFRGNLKDNIQHEVRVWEPDSLEKAFRLERKIERKITATRKPTIHNYKYGNFVAPSLPQPKKVDSTTTGRKKEQKVFVTIVIENTLTVKSVLRRNYFI